MRPDPSDRPAPGKLFLISFAILFLEMAAIRWLNASVSALAFFNNFILISCFFGLGLGCLLAERRTSLIRWYAAALLVMAVSVLFLQQHGIKISYGEDIIFANDMRYYETGLLTISYSALAGFFVNVGFFVLLGQELGRQLRAIAHPLEAYAYDIAGSLAGVLVYAALAWLETPPHLWFALGGTFLLFFLLDQRPWVLANVVLLGLSVALIATTYSKAWWSPYYKVEVLQYSDPGLADLGKVIVVDNLRIQDALNFGPELASSSLWPWIPYYRLPYEISKPRKVLILGAGAGNEAVIAYTHGVERIDVVEIDPVIAGFGRTLHPNRPYAADNVRVFVDDARSFVSNADEKYDLIVMSALDSHRQISGMSSLRLESFVYTVESYRNIGELLAEGGVFCLNLGSGRPWMGERTYWSLTEAFGVEPLVLTTAASPFNSVAYVQPPTLELDPALLARNGISIVPGPERPPGLRLSTDDWPYLYLETNRVPMLCIVVLGAMMLASLLLVLRVEPAVRRPNAHFFFLGAGFMLLETRSITQMALLFGATWSVNAIVVAAILSTIFIANLAVLFGKAPGRRVSYALLFATLALGYFFPFNLLLDLSLLPRLAVAGLVIGLPIVWASFIFSHSFREAGEVSKVFGSNLLGIVFGGGLEYASNVWGLQALYLVALLLYVLSWVYWVRRSAADGAARAFA